MALKCAGENEDEKLNEVMHEAWRFNRDCKLLRDGLQGLSWDGQRSFTSLCPQCLCSNSVILYIQVHKSTLIALGCIAAILENKKGTIDHSTVYVKATKGMATAHSDQPMQGSWK